jgi:hypothetical protein
MKKITLYAFTALLLLSSVAGCASDSTTVPQTTDTANASATNETETAEPTFLDIVPDASYFGGENFMIGWSQQYDVNEAAYIRYNPRGNEHL